MLLCLLQLRSEMGAECGQAVLDCICMDGDVLKALGAAQQLQGTVGTAPDDAIATSRSWRTAAPHSSSHARAAAACECAVGHTVTTTADGDERQNASDASTSSGGGEGGDGSEEDLAVILDISVRG